MNAGLRALELAEALELPPALAERWFNRGYYGTLNHNAKAVYQRYMGWYDGNPVQPVALTAGRRERTLDRGPWRGGTRPGSSAGRGGGGGLALGRNPAESDPSTGRAEMKPSALIGYRLRAAGLPHRGGNLAKYLPHRVPIVVGSARAALRPHRHRSGDPNGHASGLRGSA